MMIKNKKKDGSICFLEVNRGYYYLLARRWDICMPLGPRARGFLPGSPLFLFLPRSLHNMSGSGESRLHFGFVSVSSFLLSVSLSVQQSKYLGSTRLHSALHTLFRTPECS